MSTMSLAQQKKSPGVPSFSLDWCLNPYAALVSVLRLFFYWTILVVLDGLLDFDTSIGSLCFGATLGVVIASFLAFSRYSFWAFALSLFTAWIVWSLLTWLYLLIPASDGKSIFAPYLLIHHGELVLYAALLCSLSTWCFWRIKHGLTFEIVAIAFLFIDFLSGHRNLRFDMVKPVADLAWRMNIEQLTAFVAIGGFMTLFLGLYLSIATWPYCPRPAVVKAAPVHRVPWALWFRCFLTSLVLLLLYALTVAILFYYTDLLGSKLANGVGFDPEVGEDPLEDHESIGKYSQPTAVVRLEGDYPDNPFSPMLFLRETALSKISGNTIVVADKNFDTDINKSSPNVTYSSDGDPSLLGRTPVVQTVFLLLDTKLAFALDFPLSIRKGKPPSDKFIGAYQAYSMAPTYSLDSLAGLKVGDSRWDKNTWSHYLEPHPDPRYGELAKKLTDGLKSPIERVKKLQDFMIQNSIYTLRPGHTQEEGGDSTAKYLFGDMRGYCVHFSKAGAYMLRALGIPARVATGYLTDLSQSRDGHILLRMSDRHAWTEVYIEGKGWVPFDVQPIQVEVHAETPVDQEMLMELMDLIGMNFEVLDDDLSKDEPALEEDKDDGLIIPGPRTVLIWTFCVLVSYLGLKGFSRFYWHLPAPADVRLRRSYRCMSMALHDMGLTRNRGETRQEFVRRLKEETGQEFLGMTHGLELLTYAPQGARRIEKEPIDVLMKKEQQHFHSFPLWQRTLAFLNPSSLARWLFRYRW